MNISSRVSVASHQFLPDSIRTRLGIANNLRRLARDTYSLCLVLNNRQDVMLIAGRVDINQDPLVPSRLLLQGEAGEVAARVKRLVRDAESSGEFVDRRGPQRTFATTQQLRIPLVIPAEPVNRMSVTDFKSYMMCPYRFYLERKLWLGSIYGPHHQLDPGQFGNLLHEVLDRFGKSEIRDSATTASIQEFFNDTLDEVAAKFYGTNPLPAARIQFEQARKRLNVFAAVQAAWRQEGWCIVESELGTLEYDYDLGGEPFFVRGRIDRVDVNEKTGVVAIIDYKSSEKGDPPAKTHRNKRGEWIDLQLPLYRWLIQETRYSGRDEYLLGYMPLPRNEDRCNFETGRMVGQRVGRSGCEGRCHHGRGSPGRVLAAQSPISIRSLFGSFPHCPTRCV